MKNIIIPMALVALIASYSPASLADNKKSPINWHVMPSSPQQRKKFEAIPTGSKASPDRAGAPKVHSDTDSPSSRHEAPPNRSKKRTRS